MASYPSVYEQFIQDIVSCPDRLMRMLKEQAVGKELWSFDRDESDGDIVNQEYTVGAGRIDVIATFGCRTKLLVVETKAGVADFAALDQLKWYIEPEQLAELRRDKQLSNVRNDDIVGFLVAQDFSGIPRPIPPNTHLFECRIKNVREEPQLVYRPPASLPESATRVEDEAPPNSKRASQLTRLSDHVKYIGWNNTLPPDVSLRLQEVFRGFLRCFAEEENRRWVYPNPKGQHVWVHYKGVQLIYLQAAQKWFDVQYGLSPKRIRIGADTPEEIIQECKDAICGDLKAIDNDVSKLFGNE